MTVHDDTDHPNPWPVNIPDYTWAVPRADSMFSDGTLSQASVTSIELELLRDVDQAYRFNVSTCWAFAERLEKLVREIDDPAKAKTKDKWAWRFKLQEKFPWTECDKWVVNFYYEAPLVSSLNDPASAAFRDNHVG